MTNNLKKINSVPSSTCWNITCRCNESCKFCYRETGLKELTPDEQLNVIDRIAASGIKKLTFAGGEPLLIPHINDLIYYAKSKGLTVSMTSNAILIDDEECEFLLNNLDYLTMSLDGANDDVQSAMTRNRNHATKVKSILTYADNMPEHRCKIKVNTVVSKKNQNNMKELASLISSHDVYRWKLMQFTPLRGAAINMRNEFEISNEDFTAAFETASTALKEKSKIAEATYSDDLEASYFIILANGDVRVAKNHEEVTVGNILTDSVASMWNHSLYNHNRNYERLSFLEPAM